jgi:hypothetical protein
VGGLLEKAQAAIDFVGSLLQAVWVVLKTACVPPNRIAPTADQMKINYKAVSASIILVFLARALQGQRVNEASGSLFVVAVFIGLVLAFKYGSDVLARLARYFGADATSTPYEEVSTKWFSLLIAIWTWALFVLVLTGLLETFLGMADLNLFFGTSFFLPIFASVIALLIVVARTKDKADLGGWRTVLFFTVFSIGFVAVALWATIFLRS